MKLGEDEVCVPVLDSEEPTLGDRVPTYSFY